MKFCCSLGNAQPDELVELAQTAEQNGWDTVSLNDHVVNPKKLSSPYPYSPDGEPTWGDNTPWCDVWVATAMMAAATTSLHFTQGVYVLGMRHPLHVAKAVSTLSCMTGNRVSLGIGLGWSQQEFEILGERFQKRGRRTDEMIEIIRKVCTGDVVEHHGEFYDFDALSMCPTSPEKIPVIIGGLSTHALARVARAGDGWAPFYLTVEQVAQGMADVRRMRKEWGVENSQLDVYASCSDAQDLDGFKRMDESGISHLVTKPWSFYSEGLNAQQMGSLEEMKDGLKRFADDVISHFR